ncbi:MAG: glycosyltransferase family 39 protein [Propylenella sp.]
MPPNPVWAKPPFVLSAIFVYLALHFVVRMAMWDTLGVDDAEQALFSQELAWSYRDQAPPLFNWLLIGVGKAVGVNIVAISLIRYALLAITYVFAYLSARRLIAEPRLQALAVYSFAAIYVFAYYSHHDLTHTTAMTAVLAVAWYVFLRLAESPRLGWYLALGALFGLGLLGKWNFVMFAAALPLACLVRRESRPLVLTWKVLPAAFVCAAIVLPTVSTILTTGPADPDALSAVLAGDGASYGERVVEGGWRLIESALLYPQPLLALVVLVLFALPLWRGLRSAQAMPAVDGLRPEAVLLAWTMAISLGLHLLLVIGIGAREFHERLMQPPLFILPIFLLMLIERGRPAARAVSAFALILALLVVGTLGARIVVYLRGADHCGSCRAMMPAAELADQLRAAGFSGEGTILVDGFHIGGNMRARFPAARVIDVAYPLSMWPAPRSDGHCLLLWQERDDPVTNDAALRYVASYIADNLGGEVDAPHQDGVVSALIFGSKTREFRLGYWLYEGPVGECR